MAQNFSMDSNCNTTTKGWLILSGLLLLLGAACSENENSRQEANTGEDGQVAAETVDVTKGALPSIIFFGNSLSAGYGLESEESFPALIQDRLDSLGYAYEVVNAGVSGETTSGGLARIDWVLNQPIDIFVLELGGNDGLRGIDPVQTRRNLQAIIDKVRDTYTGAGSILSGMMVPPNMGPDYSEAFSRIYPELARENDIALIPFLLEGVGGEAELNQPDGIHPNAEGAKIVAENVWKVLKDMVKKER